MSLLEYLKNLQDNLQKRAITCEQERWKAIGAQEIVNIIYTDVEKANAEEKSAEAPKPVRSAKKAKS